MLAGRDVRIDLNVDGDAFPEAASRNLIEQIQDLERLDQRARKAILAAYDPSDEFSEPVEVVTES